MRSLVYSFLACCALATAAQAQSDALIVSNGAATLRDRLTGSADLLSVTGALEREGFTVVGIRDATAAQLQDGLARFANGLETETERLAVVLTGQFVHTATDAYLLPVEFDDAARVGLVMDRGLAVSKVLGLLAAYPGRAVLILGEAEGAEVGSAFVQGGAGRLDVPQGVTLMRGPPEAVARLVRGDLAAREGALIAAARAAGLSVSGYAPEDWVFLPAPEAEGDIAAPPPVEPRADSSDAERWEAVTARDDLEAYRSYLAAFPEGLHANEARQRIRAIGNEPFRSDRLAEAALDLDRDARRDIQRDLSLLEFDTRGIDGIFGPGTRGAVKGWQGQNGFVESGYLDREMIARLDGQASRRAAELEEEARRRQAQLEQQDRAYWDETGALGDLAGLRAYLDRYPDGVFSELATDRVEAMEAERRAEAAEREREDWGRARADGRVQAYRDYLAEYPDGAFAEQARAEIEDRQRPAGEREAIARAQAQEAALNLNTPARRIAEGRLNALGLKPGDVDGVFDKRTRRAIRRYQDARRLSVTGYLDQGTVVRLLADSLLR